MNHQARRDGSLLVLLLAITAGAAFSADASLSSLSPTSVRPGGEILVYGYNFTVGGIRSTIFQYGVGTDTVRGGLSTA
jgi:hypothetical protein